MMREGPGYLLRHAEDGPWRAWISADLLDGWSGGPAPPVWTAIRTLGELVRCLPGGLDLIWNRPPAWFHGLGALERCGFWEAAGGLGGLTLHFQESSAAEVPNGTFRGWIHAPEPPQGPLGEAWRHGAFGWIEDPPGRWRLPGSGRIPQTGSGMLDAGEGVTPGWLWGEAAIPIPALVHLDVARLARALEEAQGRIERALGHRLSLGAWSAALPFQRKHCHWRIGLLGGAEHQRAGGDWERAAENLRALQHSLERALKAAVKVGPCEDPGAARVLGAQAMREGLPWRDALPLPPHPAAFTPGLGADFRIPSPLEARAGLPAPLADLLDDPPAALLRVPSAPTDGAARHFTSTLGPASGIRWLPPDIVAPGPWDPDQAWVAASAFPLPALPGNGVQGSLFADWAG